MGKVKILSFDEVYDASVQTLRSSASMRLSDSLKAKFYTQHPGNAAGIELEGPNWSVSHHSPSKNTFLKYKKPLGSSSTLTVSQAVPNNKWFLVPNPAVTVVRNRVGGKDARAEATWDMLSRTGFVASTIYSGEDRQYKATLRVTSNKGVGASARAKLRGGLLHSVSATVNTVTGPVLTLKSRLPDGTKTKTSYLAGPKLVTLKAEHTAAAASEGGAVATAWVDVVVPVGKAGAKPGAVLGLKWKF